MSDSAVCNGEGSAVTGDGGFIHEALFYSGDDEFLTGTLPFVREGLETDEAVLVALDRPKIDSLKEALGADARRIGFVDMRELGVNPARILSAWIDFVAAHEVNGSSPRRLRGIGEPIWPGRSPSELIECEHHESLLNLAFDGGRPWSLRCPYDVDRLDDEVVETAMRTHPQIVERGASRASALYVDPSAGGSPFYGDLPAPPRETAALEFSGGPGLREVRRFVAAHAERVGLGAEATATAVTAVNELASNSLRHAHGEGVLRVWSDDAGLVCEVEDSGRLTEPLVGRTRPTPKQLGGRGVWLVNQLCDLVQIRTVPHGTVIRLRVSRD